MSNSIFKELKNGALRKSDDRGHLDVLFEQGQVVLKRSFSKAGVFRGMHLQRPPHDQIKLIRVVSGRIIDFVVDPSQVPAELHRRELSPAEGWVLIDAHLAHGFYAIQDSEFEYFCIGAYNESYESSYSIVDVLQSKLGLSKLILSAKDQAAVPLMPVNVQL
jgi:dTDP-4-dehydrorhamnose 3,5-epimerase